MAMGRLVRSEVFRVWAAGPGMMWWEFEEAAKWVGGGRNEGMEWSRASSCLVCVCEGERLRVPARPADSAQSRQV